MEVLQVLHAGCKEKFSTKSVPRVCSVRYTDTRSIFGGRNKRTVMSGLVLRSYRTCEVSASGMRSYRTYRSGYQVRAEPLPPTVE